MRRLIRSGEGREPAAIEALPRSTRLLAYPLDPALNRCSLVPVVRPGDRIEAGQILARAEALVLHASQAGRVSVLDGQSIQLGDCREQTVQPVWPQVTPPDRAALPSFAAEMGLAGMGGSLFPAAIKLRAATSIHTLVINAVECEPGIEIDEALARHEAATVAAGVETLRTALGASGVVLAVKRNSVLAGVSSIDGTPVRVLRMPNHYPAGAERLIVGRLEGRLPATGQLPFAFGYMVFSVASLWAIGRRVREGRPSIDRPLTLGTDNATRNTIVPVGMRIGDLLDAFGVRFDPAAQMLVAGGLIMGRRADPDMPITKGTNAVFVRTIDRRLCKPEEPCILCGSCFDACPLGLHPIGMAERLRAGRDTAALREQLQDCFLCGACSAVCPSEIPLVRRFHEGKQWLRTRT